MTHVFLDLANRFEASEKPDRNLDMAAYDGYVGTMGAWPTYSKYTENAAKLVPIGMRYAVFSDGGGNGPYAMIMRDNEPVISEGRGATIALALCAAAMRAKAKAANEVSV